MKTIIDELIVMVQERAEQLNVNKGYKIYSTVNRLNKEIDTLNIAIKVIQCMEENEQAVNRIAACDRNDFRKWQDEKRRNRK